MDAWLTLAAPGVVPHAVRLETVNFWMGVAGLALTVVGFWIALVQIARTKTAAEAAASANTVGTKRIRYNQLLTLMPQLQSVEPDLDAAVNRNDAYAAERALVRWRQIATQASGILREVDVKHREIADQIDAACSSARNAKGRLSDLDPSKKVVAVVASARKDLASATDALSVVVGNLATDVDGGTP